MTKETFAVFLVDTLTVFALLATTVVAILY